jgi:hypothetical protein
MKKVLLMFVVASFLVSCGKVNTAESTNVDSTQVADSTQVIVDSTACDPKNCDTTKACCKDSVKVAH